MIRRVFLNRLKHYSVAMVYARVDKDNVTLKIGDCDRVVDLALDDYDVETRENSLYKIDKLVAVLTEFQEALHKRYAEGK